MKFSRHTVSVAVACLLVLATSPALAKFDISGVDDKLEANIRAHATLSQEPCDAPRWRLQQLRRELRKQVVTALRAYGYYQPQIQQDFSSDDSCWHMQLSVDKGPQVKLRTLDIAVENPPENFHPALKKLLDNPPLKTGDGLSHQAYESYKNALLDTARSWGYWQAEFSRSELSIYPDEQAADVHLTLKVGPRYRFGSYHFSEISLDDDLLQRLAEPLEGEYYSSEGVQDSYSRFHGSDYFNHILVTPQISDDDSDQTVPLQVDLAMASKHSFGAGVGFSTDQGPRVRANYKDRYVNRRGHKWHLDAVWSEKYENYSAFYTIPRDDAAKEWYELSTGYLAEITSSYDTTTRSASARIVNLLPHDWVMNTGINLRNDRYSLSDGPLETRNLVLPGIGFTWVSAEDTSRQTRGLRFETGVTVSHNNWKSDLDFIQAYTRTKGIWSPFKRARFISRLEVGGTKIDDFSKLPPSVRFFTGGDNSVRGYEYNSVGTLDSEGNVVGGGKLVVGSLEFDYLILNSWSLSTFYDTGDAFDKEPNLVSSWGVGVRWYSPIGSLRLDVAFPNDSDEDYRLHISVGADL